jgi:hypothetical protein
MSGSPQLKKRKASVCEAEGPALVSVEAEPQLLVKRLSEKARLPTRGSALAAGYDLYRCCLIYSRQRMQDTNPLEQCPKGSDPRPWKSHD